jgi:hypothetical protein
MEKKEEISTIDVESGYGVVSVYIYAEAEKACIRKLDLVLLPFLALIRSHLSPFSNLVDPPMIDLLQFS